MAGPLPKAGHWQVRLKLCGHALGARVPFLRIFWFFALGRFGVNSLLQTEKRQGLFHACELLFRHGHAVPES